MTVEELLAKTRELAYLPPDTQVYAAWDSGFATSHDIEIGVADDGSVCIAIGEW